MATRFVDARDRQRNLQLHGTDHSPTRGDPITPPIDARRAAAQSFKVESRSKRAGKSAHANDARHPAHQSNAAQNHAYLAEQQVQEQQQAYYAQQPQQNRGTDVFDDTVTTNFDATLSSMELRSDIPFSQVTRQSHPPARHSHPPAHQYRQGEDSDEFEDPNQLQEPLDDPTINNNIGVQARGREGSPSLNRKKSSEQLNQKSQETMGSTGSNAIAGRFHPAAPHPAMQLRPGDEDNAMSPGNRSSKKRNRASEPLRETTNHVSHQPQPLEYEDDDMYEASSSGPSQQGFKDEDGPIHFEIINGADEEIREADMPSSPQKYTPYEEYRDYNDDELKAMSYEQLKNETWDENPSAEHPPLPQELSSPDIPLDTKLNLLLTGRVDDDTHDRFFAEMPAAEWNQAGEHILSRMSELMTKLREARENKRKLVESFEKVYQLREKAVRGKSEHYDNKLTDMKGAGEEMLRGRF